MLIQEALVRYLTSHEKLRPLVGDRVYYMHLPQGPKLPAITFFLVDGSSVECQQGQVGLCDARYQFDCWGSTITEASWAAIELRKAMDLVHVDLNGVSVTSNHISSQDDYEDQSRISRKIMEFQIIHSEEVD